MADEPSRDGRTTEADPGAADADAPDDAASADPDADAASDSAGAVDDDLKRRLRDAYLNDEERELVVTGVRSTGGHVVVEFRPPHGGATHVERFSAPRDGSLTESESFVSFLDAVGVSPLDVDELVGARVPATYDPEAGWRIDDSYVGDRPDDEPAATARRRAADWLWTYRYWLLAVLLVGGELVFVAVVILLYT